jgi:hypothetical protein
MGPDRLSFCTSQYPPEIGAIHSLARPFQVLEHSSLKQQFLRMDLKAANHRDQREPRK